MKKTPVEEINEILSQKLDRHTKQKLDEKLGYDAGWIDALKYVLTLLNAEKK